MADVKSDLVQMLAAQQKEQAAAFLDVVRWHQQSMAALKETIRIQQEMLAFHENAVESLSIAAKNAEEWAEAAMAAIEQEAALMLPKTGLRRTPLK